jgi:hypothetical protein
METASLVAITVALSVQLTEAAVLIGLSQASIMLAWNSSIAHNFVKEVMGIDLDELGVNLLVVAQWTQAMVNNVYLPNLCGLLLTYAIWFYQITTSI